MSVVPAVWRLRVSCDVRRISGTDQFDVHWFHKNNENEIIDLGQVEVEGYTDNRERIVLGTQWINKPFNESMLGEYWCQVIVTSSQPSIYLGKSDILVIRDPEDYNTTMYCTGIISVSTSKCADGSQTNTMIQVFASSSSSSSSFSASSSSSCSASSSSSSSYTVFTTSFPSLTISNSQTNYSSIQINTPSNSPVKRNDSGLASYYIVIVIVFIIIIMLGVLLVISCLVILCIKRKKKIEDTIYYGKLIITLCIIYHFYVFDSNF